MLAALLLSGCATSKVDTHLADFDHAEITNNNISYVFKDKHVVNEGYPRESGLTLKDGRFSHASVGIPREAEIGWDIFGLKTRPMVMARCAYIFDFGLSVGADESAFLFGPDFRYKDFVLGPLIGIPWDDPSKTIYGGKLALTCSF